MFVDRLFLAKEGALRQFIRIIPVTKGREFKAETVTDKTEVERVSVANTRIKLILFISGSPSLKESRGVF